MTFRAIPDGFCPDIVARIDATLAGIMKNDGVRVLLAVESGSRAWGFPSPDSDYDCRFLYVRPLDQYLSLWPQRDVIEMPLVDDMDLSGWDLAKALRLMLKGNAVVLEWLTSPIVYGGEPDVRDTLLAFAGAHVSRAMVGRHYLHLGEGQRRMHFSDTTAVPMKKLFYALRPAGALRWLRLHPGQRVAPMNFRILMAECEPPREVETIVTDLIARKAETRELGSAPLPSAIAAFIDAEFEAARQVYDGAADPIDIAGRKTADRLFRSICDNGRRTGE